MEVHCVQLVLLSWHYLLLTGSRIATDLDPEWKCSRTTAGTIQYHCTVEWEKTPEIGKSWRVIYFFPPFLSESTELASADFHLFEHYFSSTYPPLCGHKTLFEIWLSLLILQQMWWKDSLVFVWSVHFAVWRLQGWHRSVTRSWSGFVLSGEVWEVLSKFCSKWICMNIVKADACEGIIYTILFWQTSRLVGI